MQADEARAGLELREGAIQVLVAEDPLRLVGLVRAAEEDDLGVPLHELDLRREVLAHGLHREGEHAGAREQGGAAIGVVVSSSVSSSMPSRGARPARRSRALRRVVRDEAEAVPVGPERPHGFGPTRHGLARHVQDAVDVEQNRRHAPRVYSRPPRARAPARRDPAAHVPLERPGGQHAQKTETRVEAIFDVEASATLSEAQKRRLRTKVGPVVRAVAQDERSQSRNRELALERLADAIREGLRTEAPAPSDHPDEGVQRAATRREKDQKPHQEGCASRPTRTDSSCQSGRTASTIGSCCGIDWRCRPLSARSGSSGQARTFSPTTSSCSLPPGASTALPTGLSTAS